MPKKNKNQKIPHKQVDMKKSFGRLFKYLKIYMPLIIVSVTLIVASAIIRLIGPNKLGELTDMISRSFKGVPFKMSQVWKIAITLISAIIKIYSTNACPFLFIYFLHLKPNYPVNL